MTTRTRAAAQPPTSVHTAECARQCVSCRASRPAGYGDQALVNLCNCACHVPRGGGR